MPRQLGTGFKTILVLMDQDVGHHGGVMRGASAYARLNKRWLFQPSSPAYGDPRVLIESLRPDGVLLTLTNPVWEKDLTARGIPAVNVGEHLVSALPLVSIDTLQVGKLAAEYFLERGYRNFGFHGDSRIPFSQKCERGFVQTLAKHGLDCATCDYYVSGSLSENEARRVRWVVSLRKPAAMFACNDFFALRIAEACRKGGVRVPEDVALLGQDNNDILCEMCYPPLSSITIPSVQVGFEAARVLDRMMSGRPAPKRPILFKPTGVVTRQSSDIVAVKDTDVSAAVRFIRDNVHRPLDVSEILEEVPISRRSLERRFKRALGRTPLMEIRRVHLERAKDLLARTDLTLQEIAERSGFMNAANFSKIFKKAVEITPIAYRRQSSQRPRPQGGR